MRSTFLNCNICGHVTYKVNLASLCFFRNWMEFTVEWWLPCSFHEHWLVSLFACLLSGLHNN